jgi:hypothetical protein
MTRILFATVLLVTFASGTHAAQWVYEPASPIQHFELTSTGDVFVTTDTGIAVIDATSGKPLWSRDDVQCKPRKEGLARIVNSAEIYCRHLSDTDLTLELLPETSSAALSSATRLAVIDVQTGKTTFDSAAHSLGSAIQHVYVMRTHQLLVHGRTDRGNYQVAAIRVGESAPQWRTAVTISKDLLWLGSPDDATALVYGKNAENRRIVATIDLASGKLVWERNDLLKRDVKADRYVRPLRDTADTVIVYIDEDGPMRLGRGGELLWRAGELAGNTPAEMRLAAGTLYVIRGDTVYGIDATGAGTIRWKRKTRSTPLSVQPHPKGLLVWSEKKIDLLDFGSGVELWPREAELPRGWAPRAAALMLFAPMHFDHEPPRVVQDDSAYVAGHEMLAAIDIPTGRVTTISGFRFGDNEPPLRLELANGGFVVSSNQNLARFDATGRQIFHRYFKGPGMSGWGKVGLFGAAFAGTLAGAAAGATYNPFNPTWTLYSVYGKRFSATRDAERFFYVFFEPEKATVGQTFGIVRLDKETGDETGRVWLNVRNPKYLVNDDTQTVFLNDDDRVIRALRFENGNAVSAGSAGALAVSGESR